MKPGTKETNNLLQKDSDTTAETPVIQFPDSDRSSFQTGTSAYYVYDIARDAFVYMDEAIKDITGIPAGEFINKTPLETLGEVAEYSHLEAINEFAYNTVTPKIGTAEDDPITVNLIYNIFSRDNVHRRIHIKYAFTEFENNIPRYTKGVATDITHIQKDGLPVFFLMKNNKLIHREVPDADTIIKKSSLPLSRAEINVLRHTARGKAPKEIAEIMKISLSTLYTHRKNIKNKMKKDINLVIAILREKGFIS